MNVKELKTLLKENNIPFYAYWGKKKLLGLANDHDLLPKPEPEKEKSKNDKYDRLKRLEIIREQSRWKILKRAKQKPFHRFMKHQNF